MSQPPPRCQDPQAHQWARQACWVEGPQPAPPAPPASGASSAGPFPLHPGWSRSRCSRSPSWLHMSNGKPFYLVNSFSQIRLLSHTNSRATHKDIRAGFLCKPKVAITSRLHTSERRLKKSCLSLEKTFTLMIDTSLIIPMHSKGLVWITGLLTISGRRAGHCFGNRSGKRRSCGTQARGQQGTLDGIWVNGLFLLVLLHLGFLVLLSY